jgi:hypothetical protein
VAKEDYDRLVITYDERVEFQVTVEYQIDEYNYDERVELLYAYSKVDAEKLIAEKWDKLGKEYRLVGVGCVMPRLRTMVAKVVLVAR